MFICIFFICCTASTLSYRIPSAVSNRSLYSHDVLNKLLTMYKYIYLIFRPGMALIVNVGNKKDIQPPPANFPTCGNYFVPIDE